MDQEVKKEDTEKTAEEAKKAEEPKESEQAKEEGSKSQAPESGDGKTETPKEAKPEMSKEERSIQAEMRRLREENAAQRRQLEAVAAEKKRSISDKALTDLGLTKEDLDDPDSLNLALGYMEGAAKGEENPALYAYRQMRNKSAEAKKNAKEADERRKADEAKASQAVKDDIERFQKEFPGVDMAKLLAPDEKGNESDFMKAFRGIDMNGHITDYYRIYANLKGINAKPAAPSEAAKTMAVPPTNGQQTNEDNDDVPNKSWSWEKIHDWERRHGV